MYSHEIIKKIDKNKWQGDNLQILLFNLTVKIIVVSFVVYNHNFKSAC